MTLNDFPSWLEIDEGYLCLIDRKLYDFTPWEILLGDDYLVRYESLRKNYPDRKLVPFFYRQDNDDIACWEKDNGGKVIVVHDFASPGWENSHIYEDFWSWFRDGVEDMIDWGRDNNKSN